MACIYETALRAHSALYHWEHVGWLMWPSIYSRESEMQRGQSCPCELTQNPNKCTPLGEYSKVHCVGNRDCGASQSDFQSNKTASKNVSRRRESGLNFQIQSISKVSQQCLNFQDLISKAIYSTVSDIVWCWASRSIYMPTATADMATETGLA